MWQKAKRKRNRDIVNYWCSRFMTSQEIGARVGLSGQQVLNVLNKVCVKDEEGWITREVDIVAYNHMMGR